MTVRKKEKFNQLEARLNFFCNNQIYSGSAPPGPDDAVEQKAQYIRTSRQNK